LVGFKPCFKLFVGFKPCGLTPTRVCDWHAACLLLALHTWQSAIAAYHFTFTGYGNGLPNVYVYLTIDFDYMISC
jgi:hypothetical protein